MTNDNNSQQQEFNLLKQKGKSEASTINVSLDVFTGPLDALYNLIVKHKIEIFEVPMVEVTNQFLKYAKSSPPMELSGDFLELATRLLYIKSASILKMNREVERKLQLHEEEEEIAKQLLLRLQEFKKYKDASLTLSSMITPRARSYFKNRPEIITKEVFDLTCVTTENLYQAIIDLITLELSKEAQEKLIQLSDSKLQKIYRDKFLTVEHKVEKIEHILETKDMIHLFDIVKKDNKMDKIVTFLAILEMNKSRQVNLIQEKPFEDVIIEKNTYSDEYNNNDNKEGDSD